MLEPWGRREGGAGRKRKEEEKEKRQQASKLLFFLLFCLASFLLFPAGPAGRLCPLTSHHDTLLRVLLLLLVLSLLSLPGHPKPVSLKRRTGNTHTHGLSSLPEEGGELERGDLLHPTRDLELFMALLGAQISLHKCFKHSLLDVVTWIFGAPPGRPWARLAS